MAAASLGEIGLKSELVVPALLQAMQDKDHAVREMTAHTLAQMCVSGQAVVPESLPEKIACELYPQIIDEILEGRQGDAGHLRLLLMALGSPFDSVHKRASSALSELRGQGVKEIVPVLIEAMQDSSDNVRAGAVRALVQIGSDEATQALLAAPRIAIPALIVDLDDADDRVRGEAATGLEKFGSDAKMAVPALLRALKRKDGGLERGCPGAWTIAKHPDVIPALIEAIRQREWAATLILRDIGPAAQAAVPALLEAMDTKGDDDSFTSFPINAAEALWHIAKHPAVPASLASKIRDPKENCRDFAVVVLGRIGADPALAIPVLQEALHDENDDVRWCAARELDRMSNPRQPSESL